MAAWHFFQRTGLRGPVDVTALRGFASTADRSSRRLARGAGGRAPGVPGLSAHDRQRRARSGPAWRLSIELSAPIDGLHLVQGGHDRFVELIKPSAAEDFEFSRQLPAAVLQEQWKELCAEAIDEFVELFPPTMGQEFSSSHEWVAAHGQ